METKSTALSWLFRISIAAALIGGVGTVAGGSPTRLGAMDSGEISTLHAALFFAMVWIVSSLRIARLKALWRVGLRLTGMRGPSGSLQPRGPKARAATGGLRRRRGCFGGILKHLQSQFWGNGTMKTKFAASVLSALLYAQGLLGFAGLATVLLKERAHAGEFAAGSSMPSGPSVVVVR